MADIVKDSKVIDDIINIIRWNMEDAIFNIAEMCNQKVRMEKKYLSEYMYTYMPAGLEDRGTPVCRGNYELLKEAQELSDKLTEERKEFDEHEVENTILKAWKERYAWDLTDEEMKQVDIYRRLGVYEGTYRKW